MSRIWQGRKTERFHHASAVVTAGEVKEHTLRALRARGDSESASYDEAVALAVPAFIILCCSAAIIHFIRRSRGRENKGIFGVLRRILPWRKEITAEPEPSTPTRIIPTLKLRDPVWNPPRQHSARRQDRTPSRPGGEDIEEVPRAGDVSSMRSSRNLYPPSPSGGAYDDPFVDPGLPESESTISSPAVTDPSSLGGHEDDDERSTYGRGTASSIHGPGDPDTPTRTASVPASTRTSRTSLIASIPATPNDLDELGYLSDGTVSTVPPSYRTRRPTVPDVRQHPLPIPLYTEQNPITAPPSAYSRGRRRSPMVGPRPPSQGRRRAPPAFGQGIGSQAPAPGFAETDAAIGRTGESTSTSEPTQQGAGPRKAIDGGVRLAGGPLDMPSNEAGVLDADMVLPPSYELNPGEGDSSSSLAGEKR